jgi:Golgi phosphoprotein 3 (GPP34)
VPLLPPRPLGAGLAGALLAELMLARCVGLRSDTAVVIGGHVPRTAVAGHVLLKQIADEPSPLLVRAWLLYLARTAAGDVALRLEQAGYLARVRSRVPGRPGRMVPVNPDWAFAPMLRVRAALDRGREVTPPRGSADRAGGRTRRIYLAHGYTDYGSPIELADGVRMYPMWREPRTGDPAD